MNEKQPRPKDTVDEKTIESNLKKMDYPASEDIMRQAEEVDVNQLGNVDKQAFTEKQLTE
jgi:hypothetical protein